MIHDASSEARKSDRSGNVARFSHLAQGILLSEAMQVVYRSRNGLHQSCHAGRQRACPVAGRRARFNEWQDWALAATYAHLGRIDEARAVVARLLARVPRSNLARMQQTSSTSIADTTS